LTILLVEAAQIVEKRDLSVGVDFIEDEGCFQLVCKTHINAFGYEIEF
jgi:hypothetical protein